MRLNQTKNLSHSKGHEKQNEKTVYRIRENICKPYNQQGLISKYINSSYKSITKYRHTNQKLGRIPK